jgi:hypothetical protein
MSDVEQRAAFEKQFGQTRYGLSMARRKDDFYVSLEVNLLWEGWLAAQAQRAPEPLTDARILHLWDTHVGEPMPELPLADADKIAFARAVLAASPQSETPK